MRGAVGAIEKVEIDDGFLSMTPEEQEATVDEIAASLEAGGGEAAPERSGGVEGAVRAVGRGVLGIGSYLDELNAATNARCACSGVLTTATRSPLEPNSVRPEMAA